MFHTASGPPQASGVIAPISGAGAGGPSGRWAGVLALELTRHRAGSVLGRRGGGRHRKADQRGEDDESKGGRSVLAAVG